ncbi:GGDEF domain-containing protein [Enterococcus sp. LJL90]
MLLNIFANIGIIILNIYLIFRLNSEFEARGYSSLKKIVFFILLETLVGVLLMQFSNVLINVRVDFRFLLFALALKYLGWKISLPTIFLVALARFLFDMSSAAWVNIGVAFFLIVTMPLVFNFLMKHFSNLGQLLWLQTYTILVVLVPTGILLDELLEMLAINAIMLALGSGLTIFLYFVYEDVEKVFSLVNIDELTRLGNVRKFQKDSSQFENQGKRCSMIMLDIDHFKYFNDTYGHHVGDIVLKEVSQIFLDLANPHASFYRVGGEEFVVLIADNRDFGAFEFANKIYQQLALLEIDYGMTEKLKVTASMGVAHQGVLEEINRTLARADGALYTAKNSGRNQIVIA